ncbi:MAG TPA: hypothetical protein VJI71_00730 [Candidatus Norongarragalinales archaeon]|nr:hypothetical protein [Candidatus Norongarragalinales archaeon]
MKTEEKIVLLLIPLLLLSIAPMLLADYVQTEVIFNIAANTGFMVTLPGQTVGAQGNSSSASNITTAQIEFNASSASSSTVYPAVVGGSAQTSTIPIFNYTNIGNTNLTIGLFFNNSGSNITCGDVNRNVTVYGNCTFYSAGSGSCVATSPQVGLQESAIQQYIQNMTPQNWSVYAQVWLYANFSNCMEGAYRKFLFHRSNRSV